ncbi:hypothetical protein, partial [Sulfurisoma sediminicola]
MNIQDYYKYSWFSTLAYVDWKTDALNTTDPGPAIRDAASAERVPGDRLDTKVNTLGEKIFSPATDGGEGWQVADFQPNDAAGFAASLFVKAGTNEKILAIRGTEPSTLGQAYSDLLKADLQQIGEYGTAISQAVSLFNYVQRLMAPASKTDVVQLQIGVSPIPPTPPEYTGNYVTVPGVPPQFVWVKRTNTGTGLGELLKSGDNVTITGHSLGGHLAATGLRLFPTMFQGAVTFNAPGFDPDAGVASFPLTGLVSLGKKQTNNFINAIFAPYLIEAPAASFGTIEGRLHSMVSEDVVPGNDNSVVSSWITGSAPSPRQQIATERNSHMVEPILDALAVQSLLERLNPNIGLDGATRLLAAAATDTGRSEENLLDALGRLVLDSGDVLSTSMLSTKDVGSGWIFPGNFALRAELLKKAVAIDNKITALKAAGTNLALIPLISKSVDQLYGLVKNGDGTAGSAQAYRYALRKLNPFAIVGLDYAAHNADGALDLYDEATGTGELSALWLADRAALLTWRLRANTDDIAPVGGTIRFDGAKYGSKDTRNWEFSDLGTDAAAGQKILVQGSLMGGTSKIVFGTDQRDGEMAGGSDADRLYGNLGDDTIHGN